MIKNRGNEHSVKVRLKRIQFLLGGFNQYVKP